MKKNFILGTLFVIIIILYIINTTIIFKKSQKIFISPNGKYYILILKKEPLMSFGSGKNEMRLYTSYYFFLALPAK
jgi:hypothetical protein